MIYTVKTVVGRENIVLDAIASKSKTMETNIQSLVHPEEIKGYIFIEGDLKDIEKIIQAIPANSRASRGSGRPSRSLTVLPRRLP